MSKLYEALSRRPNSLPELDLDELLTDGQGKVQIPPPIVVPPKVRPPAVAEAVPLPESEFFTTRTLPLRIVQSAPILPFDGADWHAGEQYRMLRTKIVQHPRQPKMLVVTSASPSDGKTVTTINVAGALALKPDTRVLLLDADFRRSTMCERLGLPQEPGLSDVLQGKCTLSDALVHAEQIPNLYVLSAGKSTINPGEVFDSLAWAEFATRCRALFKYVVVDSPPIAAVTDYDLIQARCDAVMLVVRPDHTKRQACLSALDIVAKDKFIGVILNCASGWLLDGPYGYGSKYNYGPAAD